MSDLVERLRDWASNSTGCNPANAPCAEAADEIERLSARLAEVERDATCREGRALLQAQDWRAKAERLAAALRYLLACPAIADGNHGEASWHDSETAEAERIARAALSDSPAALAKEPQG